MDGFEPHGHITPGTCMRGSTDVVYTAGMVGRGVPGVVGSGGCRRGAIPGTTQAPSRYPYLVYSEAKALPTAK